MLPAQNESLQRNQGRGLRPPRVSGAVGLALSPVLPANVYPVLVEVPPDGVHDGFVVSPYGLQPDVLEAVVDVPKGTRWLLPSRSPVPTTIMIVADMVAIAVIASLMATSTRNATPAAEDGQSGHRPGTTRMAPIERDYPTW